MVWHWGLTNRRIRLRMCADSSTISLTVRRSSFPNKHSDSTSINLKVWLGSSPHKITTTRPTARQLLQITTVRMIQQLFTRILAKLSKGAEMITVATLMIQSSTSNHSSSMRRTAACKLRNACSKPKRTNWNSFLKLNAWKHRFVRICPCSKSHSSQHPKPNSYKWSSPNLKMKMSHWSCRLQT